MFKRGRLGRPLFLPMIFLVLFITSCSIFKKTEDPYAQALANYREMHSSDYREHLITLGKTYLANPEISAIKLDKRSRRYLHGLYDKIFRGNELLFKSKATPRFHVVKNPKVFFFSLPNSQFFFSTGLVTNYFKNEEILVTILTHEMIKSIRSIYPKKTIIPTGYIRTQRMLALTKIPLKVKTEVNKWTYLATRRAGHDPESTLQWIQTQNKNSLEFKMQHAGSQDISQEEFLFKNFMTTAKKNHSNKKGRRSPSDFYHFITLVKTRSI